MLIVILSTGGHNSSPNKFGVSLWQFYEWPSYQFKIESKCSKCGQDIKTEFKKEYWVTIDVKDSKFKKEIWMWNRKLGNC